MHFFSKTVLLVDSLELVGEGPVAFEDEGDKRSSFDSTNSSSDVK